MSVVGLDKLLDDIRQSQLLGQFHSLGHVADDDLRAFLASEAVVRIDRHLVFREEHGIGHLAYVMIECPRAHQQAVGFYLVGYLRGQVTHGDGVLEGTWRYLAQVSQDAFVGVGQFKQCHVGDESERLFYDIHQGIGEEQEDAVDDKS